MSEGSLHTAHVHPEPAPVTPSPYEQVVEIWLDKLRPRRTHEQEEQVQATRAARVTMLAMYLQEIDDGLWGRHPHKVCLLMAHTACCAPKHVRALVEPIRSAMLNRTFNHPNGEPRDVIHLRQYHYGHIVECMIGPGVPPRRH